MLIKKHYNKNDYCLSKSGHWVRDFTKPIAKPFDINEMIANNDMSLFLENELRNEKKYKLMEYNSFHDNVIIIGDGFNYEDSLKIIDSLPNNVTIIGINSIFANWNAQKKLNYYVVNNPYQECLSYFPRSLSYWPKCIASIRTYPEFLEAYRGNIYVYSPCRNAVFSGVDIDKENMIDDYRNSACAALSIAYKLKAKRILLLSLLELYEQERPGMIKSCDNYWFYPQQKTAHDLIDATLYWLQKAKISVYYTQKSPVYEFATYIPSNDLKKVF